MMLTFQRVHVPLPGDHVATLYGIVKLENGEPEHTYCCSLTPLVWIEPIGFLEEEWSEESPYDCGGYYSVPAVKRGLQGLPFDADDDDGAREEAQGNW